MTRGPWVQAKPDRAWGRAGEAYDTSIGWRFANPALVARDKATYSMPETAEEVARIDGVSREDADAFALRSHQRAIAALDGGRLAHEIVAVPTPRGPLDVAEGPPRYPAPPVLAGLRPRAAGGPGVTHGHPPLPPP